MKNAEITHIDQLFDFPCQFPIKVMGKNHPDFEGTVVSIIRKHAPSLGEGAVTSRGSKGGRFVSVTVTIEATSRIQLDTIYLELTALEEVLWAL